ncbi:TSUP family transporter [Corallincola platygyrae]|uniref:Probable membrane transporter protein n=1 Tax=Corallincola platygyrae TaxID=1193278 RepID=A0ABW4XUE0_9GAMM
MLELAPELHIWLWLCGAALVAGFVDAIAGGGGLLTVPALMSAGLPPHIVLGTNKLAATFGSFAASLTYYRKKLFSPLFWWKSLLTTALGAIIGTFMVDMFSSDVLEKMLPVIIILIAIYTLFQPKIDNNEGKLPKASASLSRKQVSQGITLGFYDGFAGPGTGAFWTVSNMVLYKIDILWSSGVAKAMNFVSNACSLAAFIWLGHVNWLMGLAMGGFIMLGSFIGAHSAIRFGAKFIRPVFITMVIVMAGNLAWRAW